LAFAPTAQADTRAKSKEPFFSHRSKERKCKFIDHTINYLTLRFHNQMRRATAILLMFLYLIPAIGISGTVHYCGGEVASVTINGIGSSEKCACGSKRMVSDCCNDEDFSFQLDDEQYKTPSFSINIAKSFDFSPAIIAQISYDFKTPFVQNGLYYAHHPPDNVKTPLYILHQVFRI
jgi:hypothetical protein